MEKHIRGNKTNKRRLQFGNGSLERKIAHQDKEQSRFDAETERLIAKYSKKKEL
jgi:hypothetical protein